VITIRLSVSNEIKKLIFSMGNEKHQRGQFLVAVVIGLSALAIVLLFMGQGLSQLKKLQNRATFKINTQDFELGLTQIVSSRLFEIVVDCFGACLGSSSQNQFRNRFNLRRNEIPQVARFTLPTLPDLEALQLQSNVVDFTEMNNAVTRCRSKSAAVIPGPGEPGNFYFCITLSSLESNPNVKLGTGLSSIPQSLSLVEIRAHLVNTEKSDQSLVPPPSSSLTPNAFRSDSSKAGVLVFYRLYSVRAEDSKARILKSGSRLFSASEARGS